MFQGFSQGSIDFLWGIRFNNERAWFQDHREQFQTLVEQPMHQLLGQVTQTMTEQFPKLGLEPKISRIYRDARRLHGRGPFKDHLWFSLRRPGEHDEAIPCFYFEIAPEYYSYGMGCYDSSPATMAKLRARIDRDPAPISKLARALNKQEEFRLEGAQYKRPKGDPGDLLSPWYNRRQINLTSDHNCEGVLFTPQLADQVVEGFTFLAPYYTYLRDLMGDAPPEHM